MVFNVGEPRVVDLVLNELFGGEVAVRPSLFTRQLALARIFDPSTTLGRSEGYVPLTAGAQLALTAHAQTPKPFWERKK